MEETKKDDKETASSEDLSVTKTENLSPEEKKRLEREKTAREKQQYKEQRKIKRGKKALKNRRLKNFFWFLGGFLASLVIICGGIFVAVKFIPLKTYLGNDTSKYVNEEKIGEKSAVDAMMNIKEYKVGDIPFLYDTLNNLINSSGLNGIFTLDGEKLKEVPFNEKFGEGLMDSVKVSKSLFGDLAELELFKTVEVPADKDPSIDSSIEINYLLYYVKTSDSPESYQRAYNPDKTRVEGTEGKQLYYLDLSEMSLSDMEAAFSDRFKLLKVSDIFTTLASVADDSFIKDILGDRTVADMADFNEDDIYIETLLGEVSDENSVLYNVLFDASRYKVDELGNVTYDATAAFSDLKLSDLTGDKFNIDYVRLNRVLSPSAASDNVVLNLLYDDDDVRIGNMSDKINDIRINDLYEIECFTEDASDAQDVNARYSYDADSKTYSFNSAGDYYVSKETGIWIFVLYDAGAANADGYASTYTDKELRFKNLRGNVGGLSDKIMSATIRQLYVAGIVNTEYDKIMAYSVTEAMTMLDGML